MKLGIPLIILLFLAGCDLTAEEWGTVMTDLDRSTAGFARQYNPPRYQPSGYELYNSARIQELERQQRILKQQQPILAPLPCLMPPC